MPMSENRKPRLLKSLFLDEGALAGQNLRLKKKYERMRTEIDQKLFITENATTDRKSVV